MPAVNRFLSNVLGAEGTLPCKCFLRPIRIALVARLRGFRIDSGRPDKSDHPAKEGPSEKEVQDEDCSRIAFSISDNCGQEVQNGNEYNEERENKHCEYRVCSMNDRGSQKPTRNSLRLLEP